MGIVIKQYHGEDFIEFDGNEPINLVFKLKGGVEYSWTTPQSLLRAIKSTLKGDGLSFPIPDDNIQKSE